VNTEFVGALEELSSDVGIPLDDLVHTVETALASAYKRAFDVEGDVRVRLDPSSGGIEVERRAVAPDGSETVERLPAESFRRLAAQTAREAVMRHLRNLERDKVLRDVAGRRGELVTGIVDRLEGGVAYLDLGRAEGVMPPEEQIPGEELRPGKPVAVVILEARRNPRQAQVTVSRASRQFVQRLLEAEVPEVASGAVEVRGIAREAGLRTKVAVASVRAGIDAVGACVGPKGVRHQALLTELGGEHVDIVPWSGDQAEFVAGALGPARVSRVLPDRATRTATVLVPRDQLSLAIGKDGQNARLAAKLTGWRIDIKPEEEVEGS
jgi:N utilization substance protein A